MINVIRPSVVAAAFARLRAAHIHPHFAGYLHLLQYAKQADRNGGLEPNFKEFYDRFFRVPGHPLGAPYIKPFEQTPSGSNLWLNSNVAGSYAPSSIRAGKPFGQVVEVRGGRYFLRGDHPHQALEHLLQGKRLPILDLALFLYRDFGLVRRAPTLDRLIARFVWDFGYAAKIGGPPTHDLGVLFDVARSAGIDSQWAEPLQVGARRAPPGDAGVTREPVRSLTALELLGEAVSSTMHDCPLQKLTVRRLLSFAEETEFNFGRLNLLVGPNGAGKSNLVDCLRILANCSTDIQAVFRDGFEAWLYRGAERSSTPTQGELDAVLSVPGAPAPVHHRLRLGPALQSRAQLEELIEGDVVGTANQIQYFAGSYRSPALISQGGKGKRRRERRMSAAEYNPFASILSQVRDAGHYPELTHLAALYADIRIYAEWSFGRSSRLREAASVGRSDSRLSEEMDNLPLALNAIEQTLAHERIVKLLPDLKETYRDYVTRVMFGRMGLEIVESGLTSPVPAARVSDGTLRFLALAVILLQPKPPALICIEEPELGMHPDMIGIVARMMADASQCAQLVITTHSEHLLTALEDNFDALFTFSAGLDGSDVRCYDQEAFRKWREHHSLGELWTSGELGGNRW